MKRINQFLFEHWPFFLGLFLGLYYITLTVMGTDLAFYPGDLADTRFNIYILEHGFQYFFNEGVPATSYWNAPFIYPQESIITFSDNLLGVVPLYALFRMLGFDLFTSFQLWFVVLTVLNYAAAYIFIKWLLRNKYSAVLGAMVFAFSIALFGQISHPQTFPRFCIPLAFLFACKFFHSFSTRHFFLTLFVVVFQFYCALYLGFMLMIPISILLISTIVIQRKKIVQKLTANNWAILLGVFLLNALLLLPLALPYLSSPALITDAENLGYAEYETIFSTIPLFRSFLFVRTYSYFWWCLNQVGMDLPSWWDHQLFPGATVVVASCFLLLHFVKAVFDPSRKVGGIFLALFTTILCTFLLYTRTDHFSFYEVLYALPGFGSMRSIGRIINVEVLFFGLAVAATFSIVSQKMKGKPIFFLLVLAYFIADNYVADVGYPRENKIESEDRLSHLEQQMSDIAKDKVVCLETNLNWDTPIFYQIDAMLVAQKFGLKTINGYTSNCPKEYAFCTQMDSIARKDWVKRKKMNPKEVVVLYQDFDFELENMIKKIKTDEPWLEKIKKQAEEKNLSLEENIRANAIWVLEDRLGKH